MSACLQSDFDFDEAEEGSDGPVALHHCVHVELAVGLQQVLQLLEPLVLHRLEFDVLEAVEAEVVEQVLAGHPQVGCQQIHHLVYHHVLVVHHRVPQLLQLGLRERAD